MMTKKIFFDANIILDMIDSDRGNIDMARKLVRNALLKDIELCTSCDILSNVYYVAQKRVEKGLLVEEMLRILEIFDIVPIDKSLAKNALLENRMNLAFDFEDLLQRQCAIKNKCDLIVTNDKKFIKGEIKHLSLHEAVKMI